MKKRRVGLVFILLVGLALWWAGLPLTGLWQAGLVVLIFVWLFFSLLLLEKVFPKANLPKPRKWYQKSLYATIVFVVLLAIFAILGHIFPNTTRILFHVAVSVYAIDYFILEESFQQDEEKNDDEK